MAVLPIITYDDPILRKETKPVPDGDSSVDALIEDMLETMHHAHGVGLAAPQVGQLLQVFVMDADPITEELDEPDFGPMVFINPEIVDQSEKRVELEEGCLSIPEVRDTVLRPEQVTIRWQDQSFASREMTFDGWSARVIQHEMDHLRGKLFLDYLSAFRKRLHKSRLSKIDAGEWEADYPLAPRTNNADQ